MNAKLEIQYFQTMKCIMLGLLGGIRVLVHLFALQSCSQNQEMRCLLCTLQIVI